MDKINIQNISNFDLESNSYKETDLKLLIPILEDYSFNPQTDFIEAKIYDESKKLIYSDGDYSDGGIYRNYSIIENDINLNVEDFINELEYNNGVYFVIYNFYRKICSNNNYNISEYFISEIDSSRTELRLTSINELDENTIESINDFMVYRNSSSTFIDFIISINGENFLCNNIVWDGSDLLIKLYEPLENRFTDKDLAHLLLEINDPVSYKIELEQEIEIPNYNLKIKGPNFNISNTNYSYNESEEMSLYELNKTLLSDLKTQLNSYNNSSEHKLNIDYSDFKNFIHFSSAYRRLFNFIGKINLINDLKDNLTINPNSDEINLLIENTISSFDGYEYYLYYNNNGFPKDSNGNLLNNDDQIVIDWINDLGDKAFNYDEYNMNYLFWNIPEYLREDPENDQYKVFIDMIGHSFDDVWVYIKNIKDIYRGDNRINFGVSQDLLTKILNNFGMKVYSGSYTNYDLYSSFLGKNNTDNTTPYDNVTMNLPAEPGKELIVEYFSSPEGEIPLNDIEYRIYKRLYHNLPFLFKGKGTANVIRTIINIYGISPNILSLKEFGSKDKININQEKIIGSTLSSTRSLQQSSYKDRLDNNFDKYIEIGLSPSDQINNDISSSLGEIPLGELIGDPRNFSKGDNQYIDLMEVREEYFSKYVNSYNLFDFIRLVKFINNSLFKVLKDFTPSNTTVSTGIIIKQHDLERNKISPAELDLEFLQREVLMKTGVRNYKEYNGQYSSYDRKNGSTIHITSGGTGGSVEKYNGYVNHVSASKYEGINGVLQEWTEKIKTPVGTLDYKRVDQREFYTGDYGTNITHLNNELCRAYFSNENIPLLKYMAYFVGGELQYPRPVDFLSSIDSMINVNGNISSPNGYIQLYHDGNYVRYIKIGAIDISEQNISSIINNTDFITLSLKDAYVYDYSINEFKLNSGIHNYTFYFSEIRPIYHGGELKAYSLIIDNAKSDRVIGAALSDENLALDARNDYIWYASQSGNEVLPVLSSGVTSSKPQGYFPKSPEYPKTQSIVGWGGSKYYIKESLVPSTGYMQGISLNQFNPGGQEVDGDQNYNIYINNNQSGSNSVYPWFMDVPNDGYIEINSSDFIEMDEITINNVNNNSSLITFLGIEFSPLTIEYYIENVKINTYFPDNNQDEPLSRKTILTLEQTHENNPYTSSYSIGGNGLQYLSPKSDVSIGTLKDFNPYEDNMVLKLKGGVGLQAYMVVKILDSNNNIYQENTIYADDSNSYLGTKLLDFTYDNNIASNVKKIQIDAYSQSAPIGDNSLPAYLYRVLGPHVDINGRGEAVFSMSRLGKSNGYIKFIETDAPEYVDRITLNSVNLINGYSGIINSTSDMLKIIAYGDTYEGGNFELILGYSSNNDFSVNGVTYTEFKLDVTLKPSLTGPSDNQIN